MTKDMTYINRTSFPLELPTELTRFCFTCREPDIQDVESDGKRTFLCTQCHSNNERYLVWDPKLIAYFNSGDELVHESVGIILQNPEAEILLFKRTKFPFLWTIPAGHLEVGENVLTAALRELYEETDVMTDTARVIFEGEVRGDSCVGGADIHVWHLYQHQLEHTVTPVIESEEGAEWAWFPVDSLPAEVTYPVSYFFSNKHILQELEV
jgi:ADP-ribose pyrophosphatase YjhB (NUDIX family)